MVRHIVMFSFKEGFSPDENRRHAEQIKASLLNLKKTVPGIVQFEVIIDALDSSNRDMVLNTLFESLEALAAYQAHPEHVEIADFVGTVMHNRACIDYNE